MFKTTKYLVTELFLLFILLPTSLAIDYNIWVKVGFIVTGFLYILFVLKRVEKISFKPKKGINWKSFCKRTLITFLIIAVVTTAYVIYKDISLLFFVPRTNIPLFLIILLVYALFSVWPQELIYRTFFFKRYSSLFVNKKLLVLVNAIVFSLAHILFKNTLVLILTFIGGLIFAISYLKFKSTMLVSIEHALYGNWLFTVGMGQMLAFPGMES
jgi:membrane protease YdiL (CAAX protease family)